MNPDISRFQKRFATRCNCEDCSADPNRKGKQYAVNRCREQRKSLRERGWPDSAIPHCCLCEASDDGQNQGRPRGYSSSASEESDWGVFSCCCRDRALERERDKGIVRDVDVEHGRFTDTEPASGRRGGTGGGPIVSDVCVRTPRICHGGTSSGLEVEL